MTPAQSAEFAALHAAFASAFTAANNSTTNSKQAIIAKNEAKDSLLFSSGGAHALVNIVQAYPGTTNAIRGELGLRLLGFKPVPVQSPDFAPQLFVISSSGRTVKVRLCGVENPDQRGKPAGCDGATVLFHHVPPHAPDAHPGAGVGANNINFRSADISQWNFALNTARTAFDVHIPATVPAGSKVWLTAFWFNKRKQPGPASTPQSIRVDDALAKAA